MDEKQPIVIEDSDPEDEEMDGMGSEADESAPALLGLPIEVFQLVQRHMNVATFFISLLTCKHFLECAASRPLLLKHLHSLPGLGLGLSELSTEELLIEFRIRAAESGRAAGVLANTQDYKAEAGSLMSRSSFSPTALSPRSFTTTLAVPHRSGIIRLWELNTHQVRRKEELYIRNEDETQGRMDILKTTFAPESRDLAVLWTQDDSRPRHPSHVDLKFFGKIKTYKVTVFHRCNSNSRGYFYSSQEQDTRDVPYAKFPKPIGFAISSNGTACISWDTGLSEPRCRVWLVWRNNSLMQSSTYDCSPQTTEVASPHTKNMMLDVQFVEKGQKLLLQQVGSPVHHCSTYLGDNGSPLDDSTTLNRQRIAFHLHDDGSSMQLSTGMPFFGSHAYRQPVDFDENHHCRKSYLSLARTEASSAGDRPSQLFIVRHEDFNLPRDCDHEMNLDWHRINGKPIALLAGFRQDRSKFGSVLAISPDGCRMSAAIWNRVYVWSINPKMLVEGNLDLYFPQRDFNARLGLGRVLPTLLPISEGVVHRLVWTSETNLFAITDQGLMSWNLGCTADGDKDLLSLAHDAWSPSAVSTPAPGAWDKRTPNTLRDMLLD